jgi:hypothetical protein
MFGGDATFNGEFRPECDQPPQLDCEVAKKHWFCFAGSTLYWPITIKISREQSYILYARQSSRPQLSVAGNIAPIPTCTFASSWGVNARVWLQFWFRFEQST